MSDFQKVLGGILSGKIQQNYTTVRPFYFLLPPLFGQGRPLDTLLVVPAALPGTVKTEVMNQFCSQGSTDV